MNEIVTLNIEKLSGLNESLELHTEAAERIVKHFIMGEKFLTIPMLGECIIYVQSCHIITLSIGNLEGAEM